MLCLGWVDGGAGMTDIEALNKLHAKILSSNLVERITEQEMMAFCKAKTALEEVQQYRAIGTPEELQDMKNNYFEALSDWRQYRKIGTLEECREAMEKQTARKVTPNHSWTHYHFFCPVCNMEVNDMKYCPNCGQKLDWGDE